MTQDEIMQLAKDAGLRIDVRGKYFFVGFCELSDLLDAATAKEREALAQEQEPMIAFNAEVIGYVAPQRSESSGKPSAWVGLTDEERQEIALEVPIDAVLMTEAKLKEKNT